MRRSSLAGNPSPVREDTCPSIRSNSAREKNGGIAPCCQNPSREILYKVAKISRTFVWIRNRIYIYTSFCDATILNGADESRSKVAGQFCQQPDRDYQEINHLPPEPRVMSPGIVIYWRP